MAEGLFPSIQENFLNPLGEALFGPPAPRTSASGTPLPPPTVVDNFVLRINQNPYLDLDVRDSIIQQVFSDPSTLYSWEQQVYGPGGLVDQRKREDAAREEEARQAETQRIALGDLGRLEATGNAFYQDQIDRYVDPTTGGIRSDLLSTDPTFANAVASGDSAINANIARVRNNAVLSQTGTGSNFSGKSATAVGNAENAAAGQRGANRSTLFQRANDLVFDPNTGLLKQKLNFQEGIDANRTNINAGLAPDLTGLTAFSAPQVDYTLPYQQQFGESQAGFGRNLATFGALTDLAGAATDAGVNAGSLFVNSFKGGA